MQIIVLSGLLVNFVVLLYIKYVYFSIVGVSYASHPIVFFSVYNLIIANVRN